MFSLGIVSEIYLRGGIRMESKSLKMTKEDLSACSKEFWTTKTQVDSCPTTMLRLDERSNKP
jgi:hypothetical protein